ncbi:MAG TPA: hypothetical protein VFP87_14945 [Chitinophagaceae bacterium]|nr:hypothetical protein [Chitinophagaceae bacterium]
MYTFQLKQRDWAKILSALHILVALFFVFDLSHVQEQGKRDWIFSSVYAIAAGFLFLVGIFNQKFVTRLSRHVTLLLFDSVLIIGGAIYFWSKGASLVAGSHAILAGTIILFWIYLKKRGDGEKITVSDRNIILPSFSADRIVEWGQLSNVVKRHDLLTIDFKNNKLLQVRVINADHIDEDEFNQFCQEQLDLQIK